MQIQEKHQRAGPAISGYSVIWDVDAVLVMFFLSVGLTTAACLSYSNGASSVQGQKDGGIKAKLSFFQE